MLVFSYLTREILKTQLATLSILLLIFLSQQFMRVLSDVVEGHLPAEVIGYVLLISVPKLAQLMFPVSFYLGVLFALSKLYAEQEMTAIATLGHSPKTVVSVVLTLGFLTSGLAWMNAAWWLPHTAHLKTQILKDVQNNMNTEHFKAGQFTSFHQGDMMAYITTSGENGQFENLFLISHAPEAPFVVLARQGQIQLDTHEKRWLVLEKGTRYSDLKPNQEIFISEFTRYEMQLPDAKQVTPLDASPPAPQNTHTEIATQQWLFAMPLSIPLLGLIAIPLAVAQPRQGRFAPLLPAILLYLSLYLLLSAARSGVQDGMLPKVPGVYSVLLFFAGGIALPLWWRTFRPAFFRKKTIEANAICSAK